MENFIVSARKYRPATFDTVVGQSSITNTLKNAISSNHLAQAYLFTGPRGVGKTTTARIFAKTINCLNIDLENKPNDIEPCNECESCQSFSTNSSFNIYELDAASNNSVDDIRQLVEQVRIPPQVGKYKVYIIDEVHMLSTQAFNAFLKTLEEPPAYVKFILATTERHKIIPTILSRCQVFNFSRITIKDMANHLRFVANSENVQADVDSLHLIAEKADGALRDALSIFDQLVSFTSGNLSYQKVVENLHVLDHDYYFKVSKHILNGEITSVLLLLNDIIDKGFDGQHFIIGLSVHFRSLMISRDESTIALMDTSDNIKEKYRNEAQSYPVPFIVKALDINNQTDLNYRSSNNKRLLIELGLMQMCGLANDQFNNAGGEKKRIDLKKNIVSDSLLAEMQIVADSSVSNATKPSHNIAQENTIKSQEKPASIPQKQEIQSSLKTETSRPATNDMVEKKPISKPVTRRGFSSGLGLGFSLNASEDKTDADDNVQSYMIGKEHIADEIDAKMLDVIISEFVQSLEMQPSLQSVLKENKPQLINKTDVEFKIYNEAQEKDLKDHGESLLMKLRTKLNNYKLRITTTILETKAFTASGPMDKYESMVKQNPNLKKLKDQLGLEIEF